jgi:hypothetical protein
MPAQSRIAIGGPPPGRGCPRPFGRSRYFQLAAQKRGSSSGSGWKLSCFDTP